MDSGLMIKDNPFLPQKYKLSQQSQKTPKTKHYKNKNAPFPIASPSHQNKTEATARSMTQAVNPQKHTYDFSTLSCYTIC